MNLKFKYQTFLPNSVKYLQNIKMVPVASYGGLQSKLLLISCVVDRSWAALESPEAKPDCIKQLNRDFTNLSETLPKIGRQVIGR